MCATNSGKSLGEFRSASALSGDCVSQLERDWNVGALNAAAFALFILSIDDAWPCLAEVRLPHRQRAPPHELAVAHFWGAGTCTYRPECRLDRRQRYQESYG